MVVLATVVSHLQLIRIQATTLHILPAHHAALHAVPERSKDLGEDGGAREGFCIGWSGGYSQQILGL